MVEANGLPFPAPPCPRAPPRVAWRRGAARRARSAALAPEEIQEPEDGRRGAGRIPHGGHARLDPPRHRDGPDAGVAQLDDGGRRIGGGEPRGHEPEHRVHVARRRATWTASPRPPPRARGSPGSRPTARRGAARPPGWHAAPPRPPGTPGYGGA